MTQPSAEKMVRFERPIEKRGTRTSSLILVASTIMAGISLLLALFLLYRHLSGLDEVEGSARSVAQDRAIEIAGQISGTLSTLLIAQEVAEDLSSGKLRDEDVEARLAEVASEHPSVSSFTVAYAPQFVPDFVSDVIYAPFTLSTDDGEIQVRTASNYDYTLPDGSIGPDGQPIRTVWYHRPLEEGPVWGEPYFSPGTVEYWAGVGTPFFRTDPVSGQEVPAGIVDASMTLDRFQRLISSVDLGEPGAGYGFIVSRSGEFISHPLAEFVIGQKTLTDLDSSLGIETMEALAQEQLVEGEAALVIDLIDDHSGQSSWVFLVPVELTGWWVGTVLHKEHILQGSGIQERLLHERVGMAVGFSMFVWFLCIPVFRAHTGRILGLRAVAATFSVLSVGLIAYFWYLSLASSSNVSDRGIVLSDRATSQQVITDLGQEIPNLYTIPTGMLIETMEFSSARDILVSGFVWQRYADTLPDWVRPSPEAGVPIIVFPQANLDYLLDMTETYRRTGESEEVIGWIFQITFPQRLDFTTFPLDRNNVLLRLRHKEFDRGVVLTPDLDSYPTSDPAAIPGIEQDNFALPGWTIDQTFFSYRSNTYGTNFGITNFSASPSISDLYFNVVVERRFITPFISHIFPLLITTLLLFMVLAIVTRDENKIKLVGFSTTTVLAFAASLFFVTAVGHTRLRSALPIGGFVYMEFFYFITYAAIMVIALNSILFATSPNLRFIQYRENMIMQLLFWPVLLGSVVVATALVTLDL